MTTIETAPMLDAARAFHPRILSERERIEAERRISDDLARELARAGFFRISLPAVYGGLDLLPTESIAIFEELAKADASVAWCVWNGNAHWSATQLAPEAAREVFADPDVIITSSTQPKGRADVVEGGFRVSGRWSLVSGCQISDWVQLTCIVHENGTPHLLPNGMPQARFMFCRTSDVEIIDTWNAGGLRGTGSHDVAARDLFVPERLASFFLDPVVLPEARYRVPSWTREIPGCAAIALGIARAALDALVELAGAKKPERSGQLLAEDRGAQGRFAQAEALVRSARLFLYDSLTRVQDDALFGREITAQTRAEVRLASTYAVNSAVQAMDLAFLTAGASALYTSSPLERAIRDVHAITQHISVQPRIMEAAGRILFGLEPESAIF
jgi:indole-3-acetate monooxygenase